MKYLIYDWCIDIGVWNKHDDINRVIDALARQGYVTDDVVITSIWISHSRKADSNWLPMDNLTDEELAAVFIGYCERQEC
ncbi:hypothetical protein BcepSauron_376 [Burkholderia phage BcepSauron]|uniref:Uncharacterized protein n=1 Tax=Burkholderia phage BcepSauron TaxID=2530033 RepID=A0A482MMJ9_9CAUD|nr:hypothetical protein H1O17_gp376 [Burkholderia phage BcepSauron]QBQ74756.1 hypothetical protein BcepSauron_376 [Burkholderia phage BcepSauron]